MWNISEATDTVSSRSTPIVRNTCYLDKYSCDSHRLRGTSATRALLSVNASSRSVCTPTCSAISGCGRCRRPRSPDRWQRSRRSSCRLNWERCTTWSRRPRPLARSSGNVTASTCCSRSANRLLAIFRSTPRRSSMRRAMITILRLDLSSTQSFSSGGRTISNYSRT